MIMALRAGLDDVAGKREVQAASSQS
jgi:hypothetical protein